MIGRISMTLDGKFGSLLLDHGLVLSALHSDPAPCIWKNHFKKAPVPFFQDNNAVTSAK